VRGETGFCSPQSFQGASRPRRVLSFTDPGPSPAHDASRLIPSWWGGCFISRVEHTPHRFQFYVGDWKANLSGSWQKNITCP
jgi:NADH:ubiquinone oxidoreductase subunit